MTDSGKRHHATHRRPATVMRHSAFPQPRAYVFPSSTASAKSTTSAEEQLSISAPPKPHESLKSSATSILPALVSVPLHKRRLMPRVRVTTAVALRSAAFIIVLTLFINMNMSSPQPTLLPLANYGNDTPSKTSNTMVKHEYTSVNNSVRAMSNEPRGSAAYNEKETALKRADARAKDVIGDHTPTDVHKNNNNITKTSGRILSDDDVSGDEVIPLTAEQLSVRLQFSNNTALNFMHFHKTGGVAVKTALYQAFAYSHKRTGAPMKVRDACYERFALTNATNLPTFAQWRCDWEPLRALNETARSEYDVVFGHQFTVNGVDAILSERDVRTFTIVRHPLARRISFYFHFFAREIGRQERDVTLEELRAFALHETVPAGANVGRDVGPNYLAGRLLSDGQTGFSGSPRHQWYKVRPEQREEVIRNATTVLDSYVFVSLHSEVAATNCLLRRTASAFDAALGISPPSAPVLSSSLKNVYNAGRYDLTADALWDSMTTAERDEFEQHEWIDLKVFKHAQRLFYQQIRFFSCENHLVSKNLNH